jgi:hypothetical protein
MGDHVGYCQSYDDDADVDVDPQMMQSRQLRDRGVGLGRDGAIVRHVDFHPTWENAAGRSCNPRSKRGITTLTSNHGDGL